MSAATTSAPRRIAVRNVGRSWRPRRKGRRHETISPMAFQSRGCDVARIGHVGCIALGAKLLRVRRCALLWDLSYHEHRIATEPVLRAGELVESSIQTSRTLPPRPM